MSAVDPDANVNGQIEYRILDDERSLEYDEDGVVEAPYFKIDLPHQGLITVARPLDYETQKMHIIRIVASVIIDFLFGILVQKTFYVAIFIVDRLKLLLGSSRGPIKTIYCNHNTNRQCDG